MENDWKYQWESMTNDELFELRELMQVVLSEKLKAKRARIERRLQVLDQRSSDAGSLADLNKASQTRSSFLADGATPVGCMALVCNSAVRPQTFVQHL